MPPRGARRRTSRLFARRALDADTAQTEFERFAEKWGQRFPVITQAWLDAWEYMTPFLAIARPRRARVNANRFALVQGARVVLDTA